MWFRTNRIEENNLNIIKKVFGIQNLFNCVLDENLKIFHD
jgi:hypothetical protein